MDPRLILAALLALGVGAAHSVLGERYILMRLFRRELPPLFGDDAFTRRTLRFAWHLTTVAWWGCALLVLLRPDPGTLRVVAAVFALSFLIALFASRGRHLAWIVFLAIALLCGWAASDVEPMARGDKPHVRSWQELSAAEANLRLESARAAGEAWCADPTSIARRLSGSSFDNTLSVSLHLDQPYRSLGKCTVTLIEDGLHDDSVAGVWQEFRLGKDERGAWRVESHRRAFRCWRGNPNVYQSEFCP